jgi:uncharacterized protein YqeY
MGIVEQIDRDLTEAMKARQAERLSAIRMIKTALRLRQTEMADAMDDAESVRVLNTLLKQRRDAAEQYRSAGREDLAKKEEDEAVIIQSYLPAAVSEADMLRAVEETITETGAISMKEMGAVMKAVREKLAGNTVDGKALSEAVKSRLSK